MKLFGQKRALDRSCYPADATSCDRLDDNLTAFLEGDNEHQSISYKIPKTGPNATSCFIQ